MIVLRQVRQAEKRAGLLLTMLAVLTSLEIDELIDNNSNVYV